MLQANDQVKLIRVPLEFEQAIKLDPENNFKWIAIYFDVESKKLQKKKQRINVMDVLESSIKSSKGNDIKQHKYKRLLADLKNTQSRLKQNDIQIVPHQISDPNNPYRAANFQADEGASNLPIKMILNNVRINKALDDFFNMQHGSFKKMFLKGKAIFLLDRDSSELSVAGIDLMRTIDTAIWKKRPIQKNEIHIDDALNKLDKYLNNSPLLMKSQESFEGFFNVIPLKKPK